MRPTPVMTPSASTSAIFLPSAAWCCVFLTNSSLMAFARAICKLTPPLKGEISMSALLTCLFGMMEALQVVFRLWAALLRVVRRGVTLVYETSRSETSASEEKKGEMKWSRHTLENSCQNAKQRDRPVDPLRTHATREFSSFTYHR